MRPAHLGVLVGLVAAPAVWGCGGDRPRGVTVTEAEDGPPARPARPSLAPDTVDPSPRADPGLRRDSLRRDSLRRDSLRADSLRRAPEARAPDFRTFWPAFRTAIERGEEAVAGLSAFSAGFERESLEWRYGAAFGAEPFRSRALALTPRDFRPDGTAWEARLVVGYDAGGAVVPQDEAVTESRVTLRFDVVGGAYRLVALDPSG